MIETTGDKIFAYPASDEVTHPIPDEMYWQESIFFFWWDNPSGLGGIHRIGYEPTNNPGTSTSWNGVFSVDGTRFRRYTLQTSEPGDRTADGLACAPSHYRFADGRWSFGVKDPDCEIDLTVEDYIPLLHMYPVKDVGDIHANYAKHHYESAGWVEGHCRLGDQRANIRKGLSYRDHSWGRREWPTLLTHRYFAGTVGPEFTCATIHWQGLDGKVTHFGLVIRDGKCSYAKHVDFLTYMEADGTTHRGGEITFYMPDGEMISIRPRFIDAMLNHHGGETRAAIAAVDALCLFEYNGKTGFGDLEITNNPRNGSMLVKHPQRAFGGQGLDKRDWDFYSR